MSVPGTRKTDIPPSRERPEQWIDVDPRCLRDARVLPAPANYAPFAHATVPAPPLIACSAPKRRDGLFVMTLV
jgi:hypothetical protein